MRFESQSPLIYRSLSTLESRLPAEDFFRINRQQVVNLHFIERIETWFSHGLKIWLKGGGVRGLAEGGQSVPAEVEFVAATRISGNRGTMAIGRTRGALPRLRGRNCRSLSIVC